MQRHRYYLETSFFLSLTLIVCAKIVDGCIIPEKGLSFGDLALRSGAFGTGKECTRPIPGKKYIMFLKSSTRILRGKPINRIRYNPVLSSVRNIRFFNNVVSGCRKMPVPRNSVLSCSTGTVKCRIVCKEGFKYTPGRRPTSRTCNQATGLWYPATTAKCINQAQSARRSPGKTKMEPRATAGKKGTGNIQAKRPPVKNTHENKKPKKVVPHNKIGLLRISPKPPVYKDKMDDNVNTSTTPFGNNTTTAVRPTTSNPLQTNITNTYPNSTQKDTLLAFTQQPLVLRTQYSTITVIQTDVVSPISTTTPAKTRKPRPTLPTYRPLKPLNSRQLFVSYRRNRQYDPSLRHPTVAPESNSEGGPVRRPRPRPALPVYKPLAPIRNRQRLTLSSGRIPQTPAPRRLAILKAATPAVVMGEDIENVDDIFAVDRVGDVWQTDEGLTFKPELAVNKTVYGCPHYEANMTVFGSWQGGFNGMMKFQRLSRPIMAGWMVRVEFSSPIVDVETHVVNFYLGTDDGRVVTFTPKPYMEVLHINQDLTVAFVARMESSQASAPSGKGFLLGKCTEDEITGRAVGSMFQGKTVVDGYGPDSRSQDIPSVPATESTTTTSTTTTSTTTTSTTTTSTTTTTPTTSEATTEQSPPPRAFDQPRPRAPGRIRSSARQRSRFQSRQFTEPRSVNTRITGNWLTNRCLHASPNGVLPVGGETIPKWKTSNGSAKYDYNEILHKSGLFYQAQRSGKLPEKFPVPWRRESALKDGCMARYDLYGGLYNGGGHEKNTIAIAFTTTMLAWGAIDYKSAYIAAGEYDNVIKLIRQNAKYLIRCHIAKEELIVQVGNHESSGASWSRPEEINQNGRTIHKINSGKRGQDVAADTAAALAATAILLKASDAKLSQECLKHAKELDLFARKYPGPYSRSIPRNVNNYNTVSTTIDNLAWSALWLGKATNVQTHYKRAQVYYSKLVSRQVLKFDWSEKTQAIPILLTKFAKKENYNWRGRKVINMYREKAAKSKNNPLWLGPRGANSLAANAAFLALQVAQLNKGKIYAAFATEFAERQLHLLLGDSGRSFVVGFGTNFPRRPRHMASSCADVPARCDSSVLRISSGNPHILYGALVGGPDKNGKYSDLITSKLQNEVAIDFNAGFQSAIAGLKQSKMPGKSLLPAKTVGTMQGSGQPNRKSG